MRKIIKDFSKYTVIGVIISLMNVVLTWFLIDIIEVNTVIATISVLVVLHIIKFTFYRKSELFDKGSIGSHQFVVYTIIVIFSSVLHILLIWFLIDGIQISTIIAVGSVVTGLFLMRFILFRLTNLIERDSID